MSISLDGKTALVTGAGRGIGRAIAMKLAEAGAAVVINDLDESVLRETEQVLRAAGANACGVAGDLTDPAVPERLIAAAVECHGSIDVIVNNAGYSWDSVIQKT